MKGDMPYRSPEEAYADLAGAICEQAYADLVSAYRKRASGGPSFESEVAIMERFFRSEWFEFLVQGKVNGEMVIEEGRKKCRKLRRI